MLSVAFRVRHCYGRVFLLPVQKQYLTQLCLFFRPLFPFDFSQPNNLALKQLNIFFETGSKIWKAMNEVEMRTAATYLKRRRRR